MIGSVVLGEVSLPITDLRLSGGQVRITVQARGPLPLIRLANYEVHGSDGILVYRSSRDGETATIGPLKVKDVVSFYLGLRIDGRVSKPAGPIRVSS